MDQAVAAFNPALVQYLPDDIIEYITDIELRQLPFSRVLSFCCASTRWKDVLLSTEYLLYFHNSAECMIFNPRTGLWESMVLLFPQGEGRLWQHVELVKSIGGLLYFASAARDYFIVWNPLTRRSSLRVPNEARQIWDDAAVQRRLMSSRSWRLYRDVPHPLAFSSLTVNILGTSDTGYVDLHVVKGYHYGREFATLHVQDFRRASIWTVPEVHRDFNFVVIPTRRGPRDGSVMLGFHAHTRGYDVLYFDEKVHTFQWVSNLPSLHYTGLEANQRTLYANVDAGGDWKFLAFRDGELTLGRAPFPRDGLHALGWARFRPPYLTQTPGFSETLNFVQLEHGDTVYYIRLFRGLPRGQLNISVSTHNVVNGLERLSDWMECRSSTWQSYNLPSATNFVVFKPSFELP